MNKKTEQTKRTIIPILKRSDVSRASIFGSLARGETNKNSDLDLLVEFEGEKSLLDLAGLKIELESALDQNVDLLTYRSVSPLLRDIIQKEQIQIL